MNYYGIYFKYEIFWEVIKARLKYNDYKIIILINKVLFKLLCLR